MAGPNIRFDDGAAYERMMGIWSRMAGAVFLDWLKPAPDQRWIDIGCGNGAFTELLVDHCRPTEVIGIDPSEGQLVFARARLSARPAEFRQGDLMALSFPDARFDAAVMALVIFYARDSAKGIGEMIRVVRPGGIVATYIWDMLGGGSPTEPIHAEMRAMGVTPPSPPSLAASRLDVLLELWNGAGLCGIDTREIIVERSFSDFEDFWNTTLLQPSVGPAVASMPSNDAEKLKERVRARLTPSVSGSITYAARANAIKGLRPG